MDDGNRSVMISEETMNVWRLEKTVASLKRTETVVQLRADNEWGSAPNLGCM